MIRFKDVNIVIDTREQRPWRFPNSISGTLPTGDYSLEGYEDLAIVERKSLSDLVSSFIHSRGRFFREIDRMGDYKHKAIIVEASWEDIELHRYRSKTHPNCIKGFIISVIVDHGIPIIMAGDREQAADLCERFLKRAALIEIELEEIV